MTSKAASAETSLPPSLDPGSFDPPTSVALDNFMKGGWGPQPPFASPPSPTTTLLAQRRRRLADALPGATLVVCSGAPVSRNSDQFYRFRASSEYVWLTGDQSANGVLVVRPTEQPQLFLHPPSDRDNGEFWKDYFMGEFWVGRRPSLEQRSEELGIECRPLSELAAALREIGRARFLPDVRTPVTSLIEEFDVIDNFELRAVVSELRLVKDAWEIQQLRDAVDATVRGFDDVARLMHATIPLSERQIEVAFGARARLEGFETGYPTIAAFGEHAATLHYNRNDSVARPDQMLLLDAGIEVNSLYTADVTRTIPISGRFTSLQRQVYEIVLAAQEAALLVVRPGLAFKAFYAESARVLAEGLADLGVLPISAEESLQPDSGLHRRWTLCSPGHMLGLDVHDCGSARAPEYLDGILEVGQVLTVEPGLYFQANDETIPAELRGQGFRIEDDVLVTEGGIEMLSGSLPRTVSDIEGWLSSPGNL